MFVLVAGASPAQAKRIAGVIPDIPTGGHVHVAPLAHAANLPYGGGPVMHSNRTHVIFWQPAGSGLVFEPGYRSLIETFMGNVAADSHKPTNVYSLSGQFGDAGGPAAYNSRFAGGILDTDALPGNGCNEPVLTGPGWSRCVNDGQIENEVAHMIGVHRFPTGTRDIYFLVTPNGLGSCVGAGPDGCALGGDANGSYCGYHSNTFDNRILYAVIPYNAVSGHCQSGNPRPNASTADPTMSVLSHEHNETVTDPLTQSPAWIDSSGNENGDLCIDQFGPALGATAAGPFNQVIHGGHYYLQEEWSNDDASCQPRDEADPVSFTVSRRAVRGRSVSLTARASDPDGRIVSYNWYFGNGNGHRRQTSHTWGRAGRYRVVLRIVDSAGNWAYASRVVTVANR
jgi:hypothetical protein